jgi:hypothetical protein
MDMHIYLLNEVIGDYRPKWLVCLLIMDKYRFPKLALHYRPNDVQILQADRLRNGYKVRTGLRLIRGRYTTMVEIRPF